MALFKRSRLEDKAENDRQLVIAFKKTFLGTDEGKLVLTHLLEKYKILGDCESDIAEGQRRVLCYILKQAHIDLAQFQKLLEGTL